jgi:hypothetical protein
MVLHKVYVLVSYVSLPAKEEEGSISPGTTANCTMFVRTRPHHGWKHWIKHSSFTGWRLYSEEIELTPDFDFLRKVRVGTVKEGKLDDYLAIFDRNAVPDGDVRWNSKLWMNLMLEECKRRDFMDKMRKVSDILDDVNHVQED